jgi:hypothetical protein
VSFKAPLIPVSRFAAGTKVAGHSSETYHPCELHRQVLSLIGAITRQQTRQQILSCLFAIRGGESLTLSH